MPKQCIQVCIEICNTPLIHQFAAPVQHALLSQGNVQSQELWLRRVQVLVQSLFPGQRWPLQSSNLPCEAHGLHLNLQFAKSRV